MTPEAADTRVTARVWGLALVPLALLAALILLIVRTGPAERLRGEGAPPVERLAIERAVLTNDGIILHVLNDGPDPVTIAQVTVDDAYWAFTSEKGAVLSHLGTTRLVIPYPWVVGEAHLVKVVTSTGTTFEHEIPVAVRTPEPDARYLLAFTLIGLYVGVIPVALGLLWLPLASRLGKTGIDVLLALTVGLLVFLFIDAAHEALETAATMPSSYQGVALFVSSALAAYLALEWFGAWLRGRRAKARTRRIAGRRAGTSDRGRHRAAQLRRGSCDRRGVRARRSRTRHAAGDWLHAAQHDRGAGDRRSHREGSAVDLDAGAARPHRRAADDCRRVGRRPGLFAGARRRVPGPGGGRDRARWRCRLRVRSLAGSLCRSGLRRRP